MRITIDTDEKYADCISFTLIGHGGGFTTNVAATCANLNNGSHFVMVMEDDGIHCRLEQKQEQE